MDSITQGLLGAATAELGFRQRIGPRATLVAFTAALLPDLDMLPARLLRLASRFSDVDTLTRVHRGPTHSLLAVPLIALAVALPWWALRRRAERRPPDRIASPDVARRAPFHLLYACVFVAVLTHGLLDWCTSYGTQLLWPFSTRRCALDVLPIVDMIYTPILAATVLGCWLVRKARPRARRATLAVSWVGFLLSMAYVAGGWAGHRRAIHLMRRWSDPQVQIVRADAYPGLGTIFLWRGLVETRDRWTAWQIHLLASDARNGARSVTVFKEPENEWVRRARALKQARHFDWFSRGRMRPEYTKTNGTHIVEFHDMRYGFGMKGTKSLWSLRVEFDGNGRVLSARRVHNFSPGSRWEMLKRLWRDIWHP